MFSRATSTPAASSASVASYQATAGPNVATIFARLIGSLPCPRWYVIDGAAARSAEEHGCFLVACLGHSLESAEGVGQAGPDDVSAAQRDHRAPRPAGGGVGGGHAQAGGQHPVVGRGNAAAL